MRDADAVAKVPGVRRLSLAILGFAALTAILASVAGGASGDPPTIAFYKQVQASYKTVSAVRVQRRGFLWYTDSVKGSLVRWVNGKKPPAGAGYRPATESIIMLLTNGSVTKYVDTAKAPGLPPLTLIEDSTGFWVALNTKTGGCYHASSRAADVAGWHDPFVGVYGSFAPMTTQGSTVTVTSTYPWLSGELATETDHISATTKHLDSYTVKVTGTSPITFTATNTDIPVPSYVPVSKPHCA
jgi:hypothetical protein